ncbi:MAG: hypothetical protein KIT31_01685 [Deltaproteobacteria bacterium]|nr:hypothetical protein [Deltaproteobacteria bacterium]
MRTTAVVLLTLTSTAGAQPGAFCELTPCLPGPIAQRTLAKDERHHGVVCKKGRELGTDAAGRVALCTTAAAADIDGIPVAAGAYTLFHPNGRIYQTHTRAKVERATGDGTKVTCGPDLIALTDKGALVYCTLAAPRAGSPKARVGEGIRFHDNGALELLTLDEAAKLDGIPLAPGATVYFDASGKLSGAHTSDPITVRGLSIRFELTVHPGGALAEAELAAPAKLHGHAFPAGAKLAFRADGTLERAQHVARRGFLPHGEEWTDTLHLVFDRAGKITSSTTQHWQSRTPEKP